MYLPEEQHITRIQLKARRNKKPIGSFYMYYMSWRQWIPYQVNGRTKVLSHTHTVYSTPQSRCDGKLKVHAHTTIENFKYL